MNEKEVANCQNSWLTAKQYITEVHSNTNLFKKRIKKAQSNNLTVQLKKPEKEKTIESQSKQKEIIKIGEKSIIQKSRKQYKSMKPEACFSKE